MSRKKKTAYVFLDTNLYLQYMDFDQIDWPTALRYQDVCLVVAPVVFSELDKFKHDPTSERRKRRSRAITRKLNEIIFSVPAHADANVPNRPGVVLRALADSPDVSSHSGLQANIPDDQLLASVLEFTGDNPTIDHGDIILVSEDGGLLNKARARNIVTQFIDEKFRLPDEPNVDQQKVAALEKRIAENENREPKLQLAFEVGDSYAEQLDFLIEPIAPHDAKEDDRLCEEEARRLAWAPPKPQQTGKLPGPEKDVDQLDQPAARDLASISDSLMASRSFDVMNSVSQQEIDRYEREKKEYVERFRRYLVEYRKWREVNRRALRIDLAVLNDGTSPAMGVIIQVVVPDDVAVHDSVDSPEQPQAPERPHKPRTMVQMLTATPWLSTGFLVPRIQPDAFSSDPDSAGPTFRRINSILLEWKRSKVLHKMPQLLTPVVLLFPPMDTDNTFVLNFKLFADNVVAPVEGHLKIKVHVEKQ